MNSKIVNTHGTSTSIRKQKKYKEAKAEKPKKDDIADGAIVHDKLLVYHFVNFICCTSLFDIAIVFKCLDIKIFLFYFSPTQVYIHSHSHNFV